MEQAAVDELTSLLDLENIEVNVFRGITPWLQFDLAELDDSRPIGSPCRNDGLSTS